MSAHFYDKREKLMRKHSRRNNRKRRVTYGEYGSAIIALAVSSFFFDFGVYVWPVRALAAAIAVFMAGKAGAAALRKRKKKQEYLHSNIRHIDTMPGVDFEEYVKAHFERLGYKVSLTKKSNDYGADLVMEKDGRRSVVQAKRHKEKIGNKAIQEVLGAKGYYKADKCLVITNSYFTRNAKRLADVNGVELWDREMVISLFRVA